MSAFCLVQFFWLRPLSLFHIILIKLPRNLNFYKRHKIKEVIFFLTGIRRTVVAVRIVQNCNKQMNM